MNIIYKLYKYIGFAILVGAVFMLALGRNFEMSMGRNVIDFIVFVTFALYTMDCKKIKETE